MYIVESSGRDASFEHGARAVVWPLRTKVVLLKSRSILFACLSSSRFCLRPVKNGNRPHCRYAQQRDWQAGRPLQNARARPGAAADFEPFGSGPGILQMFPYRRAIKSCWCSFLIGMY